MRLAGRSRVYKISESGREVLLYRVAAGETCVLTTTCLLGRSRYPASTVVEEPIRDVIIPAATFHELMVESEVFRRFVMSNYGDLIDGLVVWKTGNRPTRTCKSIGARYPTRSNPRPQQWAIQRN